MSSIGAVLARMLARGLLSLEQLDQPTPSWGELERDRARSAFSDPSRGWPGRRSPAFPYPAAGGAQAPRNLARQWITNNPKGWQELQQQVREAG